MGRDAPVVVLGAGIAGLVAARELRRLGHEVVVLEATGRVAGLAGSHRDEQGFAYDTGAHFVTNRLAANLGVLDQCRVVRYYGESVWLDGRSYSYPFGLMRVPRFVRGALESRGRAAHARTRAPDAGETDVGSARDWFRSEYGDALADEVAIPLVEAWSGARADELAESVGDKLPGGVLETMWLRLAARLTRRAVAIGYCREQPQSARVWHVYPHRGVSVLCEALADELGDTIRLGAPVEAIYVEDERAVGVRLRDRDLDAAAVVSTAPINVLPRIVEGTDSLEPFWAFRFRPMVFVNLRFEGRHLMPDVVTWVPTSERPFFRLTEAPRSMPWLAPPGRTMVTADIGDTVGGPYWSMDDDALGALCLAHLGEMLPRAPLRYLGCRVVRTPIAYPVFLRDYEPLRRHLASSTGIAGLASVGRNGEFAHVLMEDVYWRTLRRMRTLDAELRERVGVP